MARARTVRGETPTLARSERGRQLAASGGRPRVDTPFAVNLEADITVQPDGLLVLPLGPSCERCRTSRAQLGERVQQQRAAETEPARGAGHGELLHPSPPVVEYTPGDPTDGALVTARDPTAVVERERGAPRLQRPPRVSGHLVPCRVDVDQHVHGSGVLAGPVARY